MKTILASAATLLMSFCFASESKAADNWPSWRGPQANGVAPSGSYPTEWSTSKNVAWRFELPGIGASTPIIWEDSIFVSGEKGGKNALLCLNRQGEQQWEVVLDDEVPARNRKASGSNPSPVTDGNHVWVYYKSGELACLDFSGKIVWRHNLQALYGKDTLWWDLGTSPVLTHKTVVIACMQSDTSYLAAFEKETGKEIWKVDRNLDAPGESAQSYTTPVVVTQDDKEWLVVLGADHVIAHDAANGEQLWVVGNLNPGRRQNWRSISSPVIADDLVIAPYARGGSLTAIRMGGQGDVTDSNVVWSTAGPAADVPSPVVLGDKIYTCSDRGKVAAIDLKTGKVLDEKDAPRGRSAYSSSPIVADGHLYITNEEGSTYVFKTGERLELVAENSLEDFAVATPVFCDNRIYLRTDKYLYCLAEGASLSGDQ